MNRFFYLIVMLSITQNFPASESGQDVNQDVEPGIVEKSSKWICEGVNFENKKFIRKNRNVLSIQTIRRPNTTPKTSIYLAYGKNIASIQVNDGRMTNILIEPSSYAISFEDDDKDGVWDRIELLDDDMNLLEMFKKTVDGLLTPIPTHELERIAEERRAGKAQSKNAPASPGPKEK